MMEPLDLNGFKVVYVDGDDGKRKYGVNSPWGDLILPCIFDSMYLADGMDLTFSYKGSVFQLPFGKLFPIDGMCNYEFFVRIFELSLGSCPDKIKARSRFDANPSDYLPAFVVKWGDNNAYFFFKSPTLERENPNFESDESTEAFFANVKELVGILKQYHRQVQPEK